MSPPAAVGGASPKFKAFHPILVPRPLPMTSVLGELKVCHTEALGCQCSGSEKWFIFEIFLLILNDFTSFSIQKDKVKIKYKPNLLISGGEMNTEIKRNWFFPRLS